MDTTKIPRSEFLVLISTIDTLLETKGVSIPLRPLEAANEISRQLGIQSPFAITDRPSNTDSYGPGEIGRAIYEWYLERYGDKAKYDMDLGRVAFWLRGDVWFIRIPLIFDWANADLLGCIDSLTPSFRRELTTNETDEMRKVFHLSYEALTYMLIKKETAYVSESLGDHRSAVDCLNPPSPHPGQSKWASLQATEKIIKAFTTTKKQKPSFIHDLFKLAENAEKLGLNPIDRNLLTQIQCSSNARYGEEPVSLQEAIRAHLSALHVSALVAVQI